MSNQESWEYYGFPNVKFVFFDSGFMGLCQALFERMQAYGVEIEEHSFYQNYYQKRLNYTIQELVIAFDNLLFNEVVENYLNHTLIDFNDVSNIPMWSKDAFELYFDCILSHENFEVLPSYKWAIERYNIINLLKFLAIDYDAQYLSGHIHNGNPESATSALNDAIANATIYDATKNISLSRYATTIYGPDHGWDEGTYCADVYQAGNVKAVITDGLSLDDVRLYVIIEAPDGLTDNFDTFGTDVSIGLNVFYAAEDGYFTDNWELGALSDKEFTPTHGETETFGFEATKTLCFADVSQGFKFNTSDQSD